VLIDKGVIKWPKSLSSDDDSGGSPGITVHFIHHSNGVTAEEKSCSKSLANP
jgi:hypothetical protein